MKLEEDLPGLLLLLLPLPLEEGLPGEVWPFLASVEEELLLPVAALVVELPASVASCIYEL